VEQATYEMNRALVEKHRNGTAYWYAQGQDLRILAFFKDYATYEAIPDWGAGTSLWEAEAEWKRLEHGYDESKPRLELSDLQGAARFRGGACLAPAWNGDWYAALPWSCALGHEFNAKPYTVLKAGHWCPQCVPPPWNYDEEARRNPFFAQVWYPNHDPDEHNLYPEDCTQDIVCADEDR